MAGWFHPLSLLTGLTNFAKTPGRLYMIFFCTLPQASLTCSSILNHYGSSKAANKSLIFFYIFSSTASQRAHWRVFLLGLEGLCVVEPDGVWTSLPLLVLSPAGTYTGPIHAWAQQARPVLLIGAFLCQTHTALEGSIAAGALPVSHSAHVVCF